MDGGAASDVGPASTAVAPVTGPTGQFVDRFDGNDRLVTNEYAGNEPEASDAVVSSSWDVTSGSLFVRDEMGWTGVPDHESPRADSTSATGSAVFRAFPRAQIDGNSVVSLRLLPIRFVDDQNPQDWDGVHILTRVRGETEFYSVSLLRRDGTVVIKRKFPGGPSNGGTYATLAAAAAPLSTGDWHDVRVETTDVDGTVRIVLWLDGAPVLEAIDGGDLGQPITGPTMIGVRGDNAEFGIDDLVIQ